MTCRLAFALALAATGCDASLGGGGSGGDAAISDDGPRPDSSMIDAPVDARVCAGGNAAALAPDGSCLVHVTTPATYAVAKFSCGQMVAGGHIAYLKTAQLDTFAETFIGMVDTWIGGNDIVTENAFQWDDGTAFSFTNWHAGEPNNGGGSGFQEDCVIIAGERIDKQWDDRPCDASEVPTSGSFAYLCQY
jgi:hypothetical protein